VGSLFWIELRAIDPLPSLAGSEAARALGAPGRERGPEAPASILYVEDNPANLKLVEEIISFRPDLSLLPAPDAHLGIELARVHQPDIILMDINLPGMSGLEAMRVLRSDSRTQHIPVIALTANAMPRDIEKGVAAGFFRYLIKPINIDEFTEAINSTLAHIAERAELKAGRASKETS
jgi:CheY-like chemotaxis protein